MTTECAWEGCDKPAKSSYSSSKSKYCAGCAPKAYKAWQDARQEQQDKRNSRYAGFQELWDRAAEVGRKAFDDATPQPMVVQQHATLFDDTSEVVQEWHVPEGVCGFGWLQVYPGNSSFAHWAKKVLGASKGYPSGLHINLPFGRSSQSLARKEAGAYAMAKVLREGLEELDPKTKVYGKSRID